MSKALMVNEYVPDYLVTPGEVLEDYLEYTGLTQASLAKRTGLSKKTINEIIKAKSSITAETALRFERTLGRPAHFWSNLERQYQEDKVRLADKMQLEEDLHWLDNFPVNEMVKHGWIEKFREKPKLLDAILRFFGIASPAQWEPIWKHELQVAFRQTQNSKSDIGIISAWLRQGEIIAQNQNCAPYNKQKFRDSLAEIRILTTEEPNVFFPKLISICSDCGVAVVFVPALPKLRIYGATRWLNNKYILQLSLYLKSDDQFWFSFFHEACHVIKHSRKELFIQSKDLKTEAENDADTFAQNILIPPGELKQFIGSGYSPEIYEIEQFAKKIGIAPGIVVGRLQHDKIIPMNYGNRLKVKCEVGKEICFGT
jgi:addiction module HigA family antidote